MKRKELLILDSVLDQIEGGDLKTRRNVLQFKGSSLIFCDQLKSIETSRVRGVSWPHDLDSNMKYCL